MGLLSVASAAGAQEGDSVSLDRIEVTGSRITYRDLLDTPAVSITRAGDYLLQQVKLVNDSRSEALRRDELHATIRALLKAGKGRYALLHGDAYRIELDASMAAIEPVKAQRADTSEVTLHLRADVGDPKQAERTIRALREFAANAAMTGRTELQLIDDTALGMHRPERYRYELIDAIAKDSRRIVQTLGIGCSVQLDGLNSRLEWQRVSAAELMLYVPYSMTIDDCKG